MVLAAMASDLATIVMLLFFVLDFLSDALILNENVIDSNHSVPRLDTPTFPKEFSRAIIKLVGRYLLAVKVNQLKI